MSHESTTDHPAPGSPGRRRGRLAVAATLLLHRLDRGVLAAYLGAASLVGFEGLILVLAFTSIWPIAIPFVVAILALVYVLRERIRTLGRRLTSRRGARTADSG